MRPKDREYLKQEIREKRWGLEDLYHMKNNKRYSEYVNESNIDQWIRQTKNELDRLETELHHS